MPLVDTHSNPVSYTHLMKAVREQFHVAAGDFAVLLLDEDGTVRLRAANPVNADRLNALIDKTPARQAEMLRPHAN